MRQVKHQVLIVSLQALCRYYRPGSATKQLLTIVSSWVTVRTAVCCKFCKTLMVVVRILWTLRTFYFIWRLLHSDYSWRRLWWVALGFIIFNLTWHSGNLNPNPQIPPSTSSPRPPKLITAVLVLEMLEIPPGTPRCVSQASKRRLSALLHQGRKSDTGTAWRIQPIFKIKQPVQTLDRVSLLKADKKTKYVAYHG